MKTRTKYWIFFLLFLVLVFGFYAGKYKEWETDPSKQVSKGSFFKDWQVAGILGLMVISAIIVQVNQQSKIET
ncbi:MAG: hypothetical protein AABY22_18015 [Nanoarchaeota archaeon]